MVKRYIMLKRLASSFKPHKAGLGRVLGDLERLVMDILWNRGDVTGREVLEEIEKTRPLALTTILTVMDRLLKKGLIKRKKRGGVFVYAPSISRDDFVRQVSEEVMQGILDISASSAASSFVDILYKTSPGEMDRLSRLIEERKKAASK
ncbi:MAG TPA: BlaI/MecI/CopY family transcriptional regulator [Nitrospirota bacterium]|nr:BlaI/MecI/CopY family transcriptional regulator [Nitrospirota bacterium]